MEAAGLALGAISLVHNALQLGDAVANASSRGSKQGKTRPYFISRIEVSVLTLFECLEIIQDCVRQGMTIPRSLQQSSILCSDRTDDVLEIMGLYDKRTKRSHAGRFSSKFDESKFKEAHAEKLEEFRDSVATLRDHCMHLVTQQQLLQLSGAMAVIFSEFDQTTPEEMSHSDKHNNPAVDDEAEQTTEFTRKSTRASRDSSDPFRDKWEAVKELTSLMKSNFTQDVVVVFDTGTGEGQTQFKKIPLRAKWDTGCDLNLIADDVIQRSGIDPKHLKPCSERLDGIEGMEYTPLNEVELSWYRGKSAKCHLSKFLVVTGAPFDVLLGSKQLVESNPPALWLATAKKTTAEKAAQARKESDIRAKGAAQAKAKYEQKLAKETEQGEATKKNEQKFNNS